MSIIMRGLGSDSKLVTSGLGPTPEAAVTIRPIFHDGRTKPLYEYFAESLMVDSYVISAKLMSVNGRILKNSKGVKLEAKNDTRDAFRVQLNENIRIEKTNPKNNIFISILQVFKR